MARMTNTPKQQVTFDLERRKSYAFRCIVKYADKTPVDLTGCTIRFVVKPNEYDEDLTDYSNLIVNAAASIPDPLNGEAFFNLQAAELDEAPGEYYYSLVLWTADGFSVVIVKGQLNLLSNTDSASVSQTYSGGLVLPAMEIIMRGYDVINIVAPAIVGAASMVGITAHHELTGLGNDDHTQYALANGSRGAFAPTVHTHSIGNVTGLQAALDGKSATGHGHSIGDTSGLQAALDSKASSSHAHSLDSLTDVTAAAPVTGDVVRFNGTEWVPYQLPRMWSGEADGGQHTGPTLYNMTITFPAGRFTAAPRVFAQISNQASGSPQLQVRTTAITSTQCNVGFFLTTGGALNAHWCVADIFAIQDV